MTPRRRYPIRRFVPTPPGQQYQSDILHESSIQRLWDEQDLNQDLTAAVEEDSEEETETEEDSSEEEQEEESSEKEGAHDNEVLQVSDDENSELEEYDVVKHRMPYDLTRE